MSDGLEPQPNVTALRRFENEAWIIQTACTGSNLVESQAASCNRRETLPVGFEEILRETQARVGQDGFAFDGTILVASYVQVNTFKKTVAIELSPVPYSYHLASRRYGETYGYDQAPYRAAVSSVLLETAEGLWLLGQRSMSVDISKGKAGFSAGGFVDSELIRHDNAFLVAALRELEEELGVGARDISHVCPYVLLTSWRKVEVCYRAKTLLTLQEVRARAKFAKGQDEHQRIIGVQPKAFRAVLDRYDTWPGVREALTEALQFVETCDE